MRATLHTVAAWGVHLLTASGAALALLALAALAEGRTRPALGWMLLALLVDSVDGTLARRLAVAERVPRIDGALLDNIVDYANYAVVPAFLILRAGLLPPRLELAGAAVICLASAFQFAHREAKTADCLFRGFPSYWNVVALYLLVLGWGARANLAVVLGLAVLTFAPVYGVYPSRTPVLRVTTLVATAAWGACLVAIVLAYPDPPRPLVLGSLVYAAYYVALSAVLTLRRRRSGKR